MRKENQTLCSRLRKYKEQYVRTAPTFHAQEATPERVWRGAPFCRTQRANAVGGAVLQVGAPPCFPAGVRVIAGTTVTLPREGEDYGMEVLFGGRNVPPDQARCAVEMDRAALVHGPFQRLGGNGPAFCQVHSQSIGIRCDTTPLAAVVDVGEAATPSLWPRSREPRSEAMTPWWQMAWPKCGRVYLTQRGKFA